MSAICDDPLYQCRCVKPAGHDDPVHACVSECGGTWSWHEDGVTFEAHTCPNGVRVPGLRQVPNIERRGTDGPFFRQAGSAEDHLARVVAKAQLRVLERYLPRH